MRSTTSALLLLGAAGAFGACSSGTESPPTPPRTPTYYSDVEAIVQNRCQDCHRDGGIGPFALTSYATAVQYAPLIAAHVTAKTMPPWGADDTSECKPPFRFIGDPRLSPAEIDTITRWAADGAPQGDASKQLAPKQFKTAGLAGATDSLALPAPYPVAAGTSDQFVCLVLDPKITEKTYINGINIAPGNPLVTHHALVFSDPNREGLTKAGPDGTYPCFGGSGIAGAGLLAAWAPGVPPADFGDRIGIEVEKDTLFVVQMHYHPREATTETDQTRVELRRATKAPDYIANVRLLGNSQSAGGLIRLLPGPNDRTSSPEFRIPADATGHTETMEFTLPDAPQFRDLKILSAGAHMHWVGKDMRIEVERKGTAEKQCLLQTPRYDFNWQRGYSYDTPFENLPTITAGDTLRIRCTYDNTMKNKGVVKALSEKHMTSTVDVFLGETTLQEMCLGAFTFLRPNTAK